MTSLFYKAGTSDKEYNVWITPVDGTGLFNVEVSWGPRGRANRPAIKNKTPLPQPAAQALMDAIVAEKMSKGYLPDVGVERQSVTAINDVRVPEGFGPMLLNHIDREELDRLAEDDEWLFQPKFDGERVIIHKTQAATVIGVSRKGKRTSLPASIVQEVLALPFPEAVLDGELVDGILICFDVLLLGPFDLHNEPCAYRAARVVKLLGDQLTSSLIASPSAYSTEEKSAMLETIRREGGEGIVAKRKKAAYTAGRPNSGGSALKHKFWATATVIVGDNQRKEEKRSVGMYLADGTFLGSVTIAVNQAVPPAGALIEVRYLDRHSEDGHIKQSTFLRLREDVDLKDANAAQLHVKGGFRD